MLRTLLAIFAMMLFIGAAQAADDATSESDAIQFDQNTEPGSSMQQHQPNTSPDPAEQRQMQESDDINQ
jgi:hypothetical protein